MDDTVLLRTVNAQIEELVLDASLSEDHSFQSRVTQFPIENGSTVSDHVFNEPAQITITGVVSNSPIVPEGTVIEENRAQTAFETLLDIRRRRQPITVVTGLKVYRNMIMTSLQVPVTILDEVEFTATFTEVTIVSTTQARVQNINTNSPAKNSAPKVDLGSVTPPTPPAPFRTSIGQQIVKGALGIPADVNLSSLAEP